MQVAAELFPIRHVCGFGRDLPDGVVPLDDLLRAEHARRRAAARRGPAMPPPMSRSSPSTSRADGLVPVARNHMRTDRRRARRVARRRHRAGCGDPVGVPLGSFAGLALTRDAVAAQRRHAGAASRLRSGDVRRAMPRARLRHRRAAGPALAPLADGRPARRRAVQERRSRCGARPSGWRPARPGAADAALVDIASFGEIGLLAPRRGADGMPAPIPLRRASTRRAARPARSRWPRSRAPQPARWRCAARWCRAMPSRPAPSAAPSRISRRTRPASSTPAIPAGSSATASTSSSPARRAGIVSVGGYRFGSANSKRWSASADPAATIVALPDALLGQRLAGSARRPRGDCAARLHARGVNPLIAEAFRRAARNAA